MNLGEFLVALIAILLAAKLFGEIAGLAVLGGLVAAAIVFLTTQKGGHTRGFLSEARFELRKVVWPTRQDAMRTTWVVIAVVILLSLVLAFFDVVIQSAVKWLLAR